MPATNPFTVVPGFDALVNTGVEGAPGKTVHVPVPLIGVLPFNVTPATLHTNWSVPALALVTAGNTVMVIILEYCGLQTPL
ncbi:hypothetical protein D3C87_1953530 [compost metagenome]